MPARKAAAKTAEKTPAKPRARRSKPKAEESDPNKVQIPPALWDRYRALRARREQFEEAEKRAREQIEQIAGDAEHLMVGDVEVINWRQGKTSRFNQGAFKEAHPELYALFVEQKSQRTFTPKAPLVDDEEDGDDDGE